MDDKTVIGPMISPGHLAKVRSYIELGPKEGATMLCGGLDAPDLPPAMRNGNFVKPTVFADVDNRMRIAQEEIFGPVATLIPYEDEADALRIANDSDYGLSGTVWTADVDHGLEVARQVRTGTYTVNNFMMEFSAPFGGFKCSGVGRELGPEGLSAYLEAKSINLPMGYEARPKY